MRHYGITYIPPHVLTPKVTKSINPYKSLLSVTRSCKFWSSMQLCSRNNNNVSQQYIDFVCCCCIHPKNEIFPIIKNKRWL